MALHLLLEESVAVSPNKVKGVDRGEVSMVLTF
jgi:hypothetical protein